MLLVLHMISTFWPVLYARVSEIPCSESLHSHRLRAIACHRAVPILGTASGGFRCFQYCTVFRQERRLHPGLGDLPWKNDMAQRLKRNRVLDHEVCRATRVRKHTPSMYDKSNNELASRDIRTRNFASPMLETQDSIKYTKRPEPCWQRLSLSASLMNHEHSTGAAQKERSQ